MSEQTILEMMTSTEPCSVGEITSFARGWSVIRLESKSHSYFGDSGDGKLCHLLAQMWIRDFATDTVLLTDSGMIFKSEDDAALFKLSCPSQPIEEVVCEDDDWDEFL